MGHQTIAVPNAVGVCSKGVNFVFANLSFTHVIVGVLGITVLH